jgi:hypothetical protein
VAAATRLAAARREQRLAALRLAGVTLAQAGALSATEAVLSAVAGVGVGFVVFALLRPAAAGIPFDGDTFYPGDLRLTAASAALVGFGVPILAVAAALVSSRRVRVSPLGVARHTPRPRPTWRRAGGPRHRDRSLRRGAPGHGPAQRHPQSMALMSGSFRSSWPATGEPPAPVAMCDR